MFSPTPKKTFYPPKIYMQQPYIPRCGIFSLQVYFYFFMEIILNTKHYSDVERFSIKKEDQEKCPDSFGPQLHAKPCYRSTK